MREYMSNDLYNILSKRVGGDKLVSNYKKMDNGRRCIFLLNALKFCKIETLLKYQRDSLSELEEKRWRGELLCIVNNMYKAVR